MRQGTCDSSRTLILIKTEFNKLLCCYGYLSHVFLLTFFSEVAVVFCSPSSITMSPDEELICAGFEDSHIQIWGLSPGSLPNPPPVFGVNHLRLGNDYPEDIEARLRYSIVLALGQCSVIGYLF